MFPGGAGSGRHIRFVAAVRHYSIDTASELLSETLVEACKESGRKARGSKIYCKPQNKWFDQVEEQISLGLCVSQAGKQKTLGMCFRGRGTQITRDMCFPVRGTHITRNMGFRSKGTHITTNMCYPSWETRIKRDMCFLGRRKISLGIWVTWVGERISLMIWVSGNTYH